MLPSPLASPACPAECGAFADSVRECQAKQITRSIALQHDIPGAGIITGDFNAQPGNRVYEQFVNRGWLDSHLAARNAESDLMTGLNCIAGREGSRAETCDASG